MPKIVIDVPMPVSYLSRKLTEQLKTSGAVWQRETPSRFLHRKGLRVLNLRIFGKNHNVAKMKLAGSDGHAD